MESEMLSNQVLVKELNRKDIMIVTAVNVSILFCIITCYTYLLPRSNKIVPHSEKVQLILKNLLEVVL